MARNRPLRRRWTSTRSSFLWVHVWHRCSSGVASSRSQKAPVAQAQSLARQQFRKVVEISSLAAGGLIFLGETLASVFGRRGFRPSLRTPHLCSAVGLDLNVKERAREKLESSPTPKGFQFFPPLDAAVQLFGKFHQGNFQLEHFPMYPDKDLKEVHGQDQNQQPSDDGHRFVTATIL